MDNDEFAIKQGYNSMPIFRKKIKFEFGGKIIMT